MNAPRGTTRATSFRFIPGRRLAVACLLGLPIFLAPGYGVVAGVLLNVLLLSAAYYEARTLGKAAPTALRRIEERLLLGAQNRITIALRNPSPYRLSIRVRDHYPPGFGCDDDELACTLPPHGKRELAYSVLPQRRGRHRFGAIHMRIDGLLGLGAALVVRDAAGQARVYPNLRGPKRYELAARIGALHSVGVRNLRRPGGGGEFEQLREYVPGDSYRELDWKATAKRRRPVTRVNGQERSQTVIVGIDAGRMMATQLDDLTKLDHAINAALLLTYVALRTGDRVGLVIFAQKVLHFLPPRRGLAQYRRVLESLYAVEASPIYVDFRRLIEFIRVRVPRRSLIVLFSDLLDESQSLPLAEQAGLLRRKHLPVCVTMDDPVAVSLSRAAVDSDDDAYRRAAAADILGEREAIKAQLRLSGVGLVEASASSLAVATVNRYLEIKNRRIL